MFINRRAYLFSLKALPGVRMQTMVPTKFAGVICLVYFTILVSAGKNVCKSVLQKLKELECPSKGTLRNVFNLTVVSKGLNL